MTGQEIEALAAKWEADADRMESANDSGFYPLHVRYAKDPAAAKREWDAQTFAHVFGMRWCAGELRRETAKVASEVQT